MTDYVMRILLLLLLVTVGCSKTGAADPSPPTNTVFRPTFLMEEGSFSAGTAFVCEYPEGSHLLLTAHHLFGTGGGLESETEWNQLNQIIKLTVGLSLHDANVSVVSKEALLIPGARSLGKAGLNDDIAAFKLVDDKSRPYLKLAKTLPKVGERLWLYGRQLGKDHAELIPCTVTRSNAKQLDYRVDRKDFEVRATSGAPVLNSDGLVVAVNIGGREAGNDFIGCGNPSTSVIAHLQEALKK